MTHLLICADVLAHRPGLLPLLEDGGSTVAVEESPGGCLRALALREPDAVIVGVAAGSPASWDGLASLRAMTARPILAIVAEDHDGGIVRALRAGADAALPASFGSRDLVARISVLIQGKPSGAPPTDPRRTIDDMVIDLTRREVTLQGSPIPLTRIEYDLLEVITRPPCPVMTRRALVEQVWGTQWVGDGNLVDAHVSNLRRKLGDSPAKPRFIETVRGVGFRAANCP